MRSLLMLALMLMAAPLFGDECTPDSRAPISKAQNEELRQELLTMFRNDQQARTAMLKKLGESGFSFESTAANAKPRLLWAMFKEQWKLNQQDQKNRDRMKQIVKGYGWPGKTLVGANGANAAWFLVQHADADVAFQKECLALMEAAPEGEVSRHDVAYLTDRVLVNEGQKQRYGTQMEMNFELRPIEDPENVDKRRAEIGLPPLTAYVEVARREYKKLLQKEH